MARRLFRPAMRLRHAGTAAAARDARSDGPTRARVRVAFLGRRVARERERADDEGDRRAAEAKQPGSSTAKAVTGLSSSRPEFAGEVVYGGPLPQRWWRVGGAGGRSVASGDAGARRGVAPRRAPAPAPAPRAAHTKRAPPPAVDGAPHLARRLGLGGAGRRQRLVREGRVLPRPRAPRTTTTTRTTTKRKPAASAAAAARRAPPPRVTCRDAICTSFSLGDGLTFFPRIRARVAHINSLDAIQ